jgi:hypothetical protein
VSELAQSLLQLVIVLGRLLFDLLQLAMAHALLIAWLAWWLWGVNWSKLWPSLARGAWVPVVLLMFMAALVWSRISPNGHTFFWHFGAVSVLAALTLFCGWLQTYFGYTPPEVRLEPASVHHEHGAEPIHDHEGPEAGEAHAVEEHGHHHGHHDQHGHH